MNGMVPYSLTKANYGTYMVPYSLTKGNYGTYSLHTGNSSHFGQGLGQTLGI